MAQHVDHGGTPHDPAGKAIIDMSEQIAKLGEFQRKVHSATLHPDATGITERALTRLKELKNRVAAISKRSHYESWIGSIGDQGDPMLGELDAVTMEDYKSKFTQTSFQEELAQFFPLLHKIMSEDSTVDLDEYVNDQTLEAEVAEEEVKESAFDAFEEWANATENRELTTDQISGLVDAVSKLPQGPSGPELELGDAGSQAIDFFSSHGLEDSELSQKMQAAAEANSEANPFDILKSWAEDEHNYPGLLQQLGIKGAAAPAEAPPEEGSDDNADAGAPPKSDQSQGSMFEEIAKIVSGRFNKDNMQLGAFNGTENIALEVKKSVGEQFGEDAGAMAEQLALQFMKKLSQEREQGLHSSDSKDGGDDDMSRFRQLLGHVKNKMGEVMGGDVANPPSNIMPAEGGVPRSESAEMESILRLANYKK